MKAAILFLAAATAYGQYAKPNPKITPGATNPNIVADRSGAKRIVDGVEVNICASDFKTPPFRQATKSEKIKTAVCRAYGIMSGCPGPGWELDDIVAIEVGGLNVESNLWPQDIKEARIKDHAVEDALGGPKGLVCQGKIELKDAQQCMLDDWPTCMKRVAALKAK